jgi:hypothetical protein
MKQSQTATVAAEAQCYLALIDLFRAEGCEPHWRVDYASERSARPGERSRIARGGTNEHD